MTREEFARIKPGDVLARHPNGRQSNGLEVTNDFGTDAALLRVSETNHFALITSGILLCQCMIREGTLGDVGTHWLRHEIHRIVTQVEVQTIEAQHLNCAK